MKTTLVTFRQKLGFKLKGKDIQINFPWIISFEIFYVTDLYFGFAQLEDELMNSPNNDDGQNPINKVAYLYCTFFPNHKSLYWNIHLFKA
jgi:hypothetical protein